MGDKLTSAEIVKLAAILPEGAELDGANKFTPEECAAARALIAASTAPSASEAQEIAAAFEKLASMRPRVSVTTEGATLNAPHDDSTGNAARITAAFGSPSNDFAMNALSNVVSIVGNRQRETNAILAFMDGMEPQDELEATLLSQMIAVNEAAMGCLRGFTGERGSRDVEHMGNMANKFLRTFTMQIEALGKLRRGGEQKVEVKHVHVNEGGQAIIGNVAAGRGAGRKRRDQPHDGDQQMRGEGTNRKALRGLRDEEREVPLPWGQVPRGAEREPERIEERPIHRGGEE